jgi:NAD(P)-dependent dehydrogenase (short-subunit alcohol dehydrogenase family)
MKLKGKVAIVTGGTKGFGFAVAQSFVKEGASVIICSRDDKDVQVAIDLLLKDKNDISQIVAGCAIDLSSRHGAFVLVDRVIKLFGRIDILVNNAGIQGAKGSVDRVNIDEWISTLEINLISVFKMCHYVIPYMKERKYGKIINLSGGGSTNPRPFVSAYAVSKTAVVRLTETMAAECKDFNIDINSIAPGALNTRILDEMLASRETIGEEEYGKAVKQKMNGGTPLSVGTDLCVFLASNESNGISGKLISAKWDKWKEFPEHIDELMKSDIYTLKRIIAKDRNKDWDVEE